MPFLSRIVFVLIVEVMQTQEALGKILHFTWDQPDLAMPLPQDLCGFSFEADRFPDWAGHVSQRNNFTYNLLNNLKEKTGVPPPVRVGGNTQDNVISMPNVTGEPGFYNVFDPVPDDPESTKELFPEAFFTGAGFDYWRCAGNMPKGTKFTWGVNFKTENASEAVAQIRQLEKAFADPHCRDVHLHAIELGNEVDTWVDGKTRPNDWSIWDYKAQQSEYFYAINKALGHNGRKYRTGDFAIEWKTTELLSTGIIQTPMGRSINAVSEHHYQGASDLSMVSPSVWPSIATDLIHKDYVRWNVTRYTISALAAKKSGIDFTLGETGSFFGHGQPGVSNSAAAALWMIDYSLQAACNGISELHFHQGVGYNYSAFVPVDNIGRNVTDFDPDATRHVMPLYYGYLAVADAIGTSGNTHINEIWTDTNEIWTYKSHLAAYQIWEGDQLKRLMLIDSVPWTEASEGDRPLRTLTIPELAGRTGVKVKTLEFSSLSALGGLKWGGQSWETSTGLPTGKETFGTINTNGTITMNASSAALIYI